MHHGEKTLFGIIPAGEADIVAKHLAQEGIDVVAITNHSTCKTGCSPSKEIWVHPDDVATIQRVLHSRHMRTLEGMGADLELINQVFDPGQATAICPACGTEFSTKESQCPECELAFS